MENTDNVSRRRTLQKAGFVAGTFSIPLVSSVAAEESSQEAQERRKHRKLSEKFLPNDIDKFRNLIQKNGSEINTPTEKIHLDKAKGNDSELSTHSYDKADLTLDTTLTTDKFYSFIDLTWKINTDWLDYGEDPADRVAVSWATDHYTLVAEQYNEPDSGIDERGPSGVVASYSDSYGLGIKDTESGSLLITLDREGSDNQTRKVYISYYHAWDDIEVTGVTIGADGNVSVSFSEEEHSWSEHDQVSDKHADDIR